jgi:hypothetical protein
MPEPDLALCEGRGYRLAGTGPSCTTRPGGRNVPTGLGQSCRKAGGALGQAGAANLAFIPPEVVPQFVEVGDPNLAQKPLSLVMGGLS